MVQESELVRLRRARYIPDIPDTLYMVDEKPRVMGAAGVDILAAALPGNKMNKNLLFHNSLRVFPFNNEIIISSRLSNNGSYVETRTKTAAITK